MVASRYLDYVKTSSRLLVNVLYCWIAVAVYMVFFDTCHTLSCLYGIYQEACMGEWFKFFCSSLFRGSVLFQGTAVTCCEGKHGGVCWRAPKVKGVCQWMGGSKKYKSEVGSWKNFSWDGPTGGNGARGLTNTNLVYYYWLQEVNNELNKQISVSEIIMSYGIFHCFYDMKYWTNWWHVL